MDRGVQLENDVLCSWNVEELLTNDEAILYQSAIGVLAQWFTFELAEYKAKREHLVDVSVMRIIEFERMVLSANWSAKRGIASLDADDLSLIECQFRWLIRGKSLYELLGYFLSSPSRFARHSKKGLLEQCFRYGRTSPPLQRIISYVNTIAAGGDGLGR